MVPGPGGESFSAINLTNETMKHIELEVIEPISRQGRTLPVGARFRGAANGSNVSRWLRTKKVREVSAAAAPHETDTTAASSPRNGAEHGAAPARKPRYSAEMKIPDGFADAIGADARDPDGFRILDPKQVQRSRFNRDDFDKEALGELIEDVKLRGVLQPGIVRPLRPPVVPKSGLPIVYELIAGERRWRAATAAGKPFPAIVRDCSDTEALEMQAVENMHREDLNPIDEARKYEQLRVAYEAEGLTRTQAIERIEEKTGKAQSTIYERLALMKLPSNVQVLVKPQMLPGSHAALLTKLRDPKTVMEVAGEILKPKKDEAEGGVLSFRATKQLVDWHVKREANLAKWQSEADDFAKKGLTVLTPEESAKVVKCHNNGGEWWWIEPALRKTYVKPDDHCDLPGARFRTYKQLWRKAPRALLARLPDGRPVHIYLRSDADAAVKAGGKLGKSAATNRTQKSAKEVLKDRQAKARTAAFGVALQGIVQSIETQLDSAAFWRWFAGALIGQWRSEPIRRLCKRRGWKREAIEDKLAAMGVAELRGVCSEVLLYNDVPSFYGSTWGNAIASGAALCKVPLPPWGGEKGDRVQASGDEEDDDE